MAFFQKNSVLNHLKSLIILDDPWKKKRMIIIIVESN
jgi:hypothetical protein